MDTMTFVQKGKSGGKGEGKKMERGMGMGKLRGCELYK